MVIEANWVFTVQMVTVHWWEMACRLEITRGPNLVASGWQTVIKMLSHLLHGMLFPNAHIQAASGIPLAQRTSFF